MDIRRRLCAITTCVCSRAHGSNVFETSSKAAGKSAGFAIDGYRQLSWRGTKAPRKWNTQKQIPVRGEFTVKFGTILKAGVRSEQSEFGRAAQLSLSLNHVMNSVRHTYVRTVGIQTLSLSPWLSTSFHHPHDKRTIYALVVPFTSTICRITFAALATDRKYLVRTMAVTSRSQAKVVAASTTRQTRSSGAVAAVANAPAPPAANPPRKKAKSSSDIENKKPASTSTSARRKVSGAMKRGPSSKNGKEKSAIAKATVVNEPEEDEESHCVCLGSDDGTPMIRCEGECLKWYVSLSHPYSHLFFHLL